MLALLLATTLSFAGSPCGTPDCPVVADVERVTSGDAVTAKPKPQPWASVTKVNPDDFKSQGLNPEVLKLALTAYAKAVELGQTKSSTYTVIDYSQGSNKKRLWIIDMKTGKLVAQEYVAHGKHSGGKFATNFSNVNESNKSSLGLIRTAETYQSGKFGYALRLDGLEQGINNNVRRRAIVMHKSNYVTESYIKRNGRAGRSLGCTALDPAVYRRVIDTVKGGSLFFVYGKDPNWLRNSTYLGEAGKAHADDLGMQRPTLRRGAKGETVKELQRALRDAGFYDGRIDGDFGRGTERALKKFQADRGLESDGVAGSGTWATLNSKTPPTVEAAPPVAEVVPEAAPAAIPVAEVVPEYSDMPKLRRGAKGTDVRTLQQALQDEGYYNGRVDGDFGWRTRNAVKAYQRDNGLSADGVAGDKTWASLGG